MDIQSHKRMPENMTQAEKSREELQYISLCLEARASQITADLIAAQSHFDSPENLQKRTYQSSLATAVWLCIPTLARSIMISSLPDSTPQGAPCGSDALALGGRDSGAMHRRAHRAPGS